MKRYFIYAFQNRSIELNNFRVRGQGRISEIKMKSESNAQDIKLFRSITFGKRLIFLSFVSLDYNIIYL